MIDEDVIARILMDELEAGPAHAVRIAREIASKFEKTAPIPADGACPACGRPLSDEIEFDGMVFDRTRNEVRYGGKVAHNLTRQEAAVFEVIFSAKGRIVSKEAILSEVYSRQFRADDEVPDIKIVDVFVCKLRKKIKPLGIDFGTAWGRGYFMQKAAP